MCSGSLLNINAGTGTGTGTGTGLGLGSESAMGSTLYERIYLLCTMPVSYSGSSGNSSNEQSQSSRYNELGMETDVDGGIPSSSSSSTHNRHSRPGPSEVGVDGENLDSSSSSRESMVRTVCTTMYGWTAAVATSQGEISHALHNTLDNIL